MERLDDRSFRGNVLNRSGTWAVCFAADWCPFCQRFLPQFAALEGHAPFQLAVADLTSFDSPLWEAIEIEVVPTLVGFREGKPVWRRDGISGRGLEAEDLQALCYQLGGQPCDPRALQPRRTFGSSRPKVRPGT
jgi:thiol-disulfide isomerase/thioredoxin